METEKVIDLIERMYIELSDFRDLDSIENQVKYPKLYKLKANFLNINNEWRYLFLGELIKKIQAFYLALKSYKEKKKPETAELLEEKASDILDVLTQLTLNESSAVQFVNEELRVSNVLRKILENKKKEEEIKKLNEKFKELIFSYESLKNKSTLIDEQYEKTLANLGTFEQKYQKFNQVIDVAANDSILTLYKEIYNRESAIADKYRNWALMIFLIVGILIVLSIIFIILQNGASFFFPTSYNKVDLDWGSLIKTLMLVSLTTPAWYLTRESSKHRKVAYKAQMLGTELAAFPLYVKEFKDEDRLALRKHLADRFFGQELYNDQPAKTETAFIQEQLKVIQESNRVLTEALKIKNSQS